MRDGAERTGILRSLCSILNRVYGGYAERAGEVQGWTLEDAEKHIVYSKHLKLV